MFSRMRIRSRLILLIAIQTLISLVIGGTALSGLNLAAQSTARLNVNVAESTQLSYLADTLRGDLLNAVNRVNAGAITWEEGRRRLSNSRRSFEENWESYLGSLSPDEREFVDDVLTPDHGSVANAFVELDRLFESEDRTNLELFVLNDLEELVDPFSRALLASAAERELESNRTFDRSQQRNQNFIQASIGVIVLGLVLAAVLGSLIYWSISGPIEQISSTVRNVTDGNYEVRAALSGDDELSELGGALDTLIQDKVTSLAEAEQENDRLNDSVLQLLEAVARLSERDLTVTIPVTPDVTGPVADAINHMAEETGRVLVRVSYIARQVGASCATVNSKAESVNETATSQQTEVERTATQLAAASRALTQIAETARSCGQIAERTTQSTQSAMQSVNSTVSGMSDIREAIQETGKRIKRLGERSQEVTTIVDIIRSITERTQMLAVNASMQAATAGEAGRGFAVVADEVQRLAESSREATVQIGNLVKNIQVDTNDTIATMDRTITQVVEGSQVAAAAGEQMSLSQQATSQLVTAVQEIAAGSQQQAQISDDLRERATSMLQGTRATTQELVEQLTQTKNLVQYARMLIQSVRVFKLPTAEARS